MDVVYEQTQHVTDIDMAISKTEVAPKCQEELFEPDQRRRKFDLELVAPTSRGSPVRCIVLQDFVAAPQRQLLSELSEPFHCSFVKTSPTVLSIPFERRLQYEVIEPPVEKNLIHLGLLLSLLKFKLAATL